MYQRLFSIFLLGIIAVLYGCASGPSLEGQSYYRGPAMINPESATIYFYRLPHELGSAVHQDIKIDGDHVGVLSSGSYLKVSVPAGIYSVEATRGSRIQGDIGDAKFDLTVRNGKAYFVANETSINPYQDRYGLTEVRDGSFRRVQYYFRWALVPQEVAELRMLSTRLSPE